MGLEEKEFVFSKVAAVLIESPLLILFLLLFFIYCGIKDFKLAKVTFICSFSVIISAIGRNWLLSLPGIEKFWYVFWATIGVIQLLAVFYTVRNDPKYIIILRAILVAVSIEVLVSFARFIERFYFETSHIKPVYTFGVILSGWIVVIALISPILIYIKQYIKFKKGIRNA